MNDTRTRSMMIFMLLQYFQRSQIIQGVMAPLTHRLGVVTFPMSSISDLGEAVAAGTWSTRI